MHGAQNKTPRKKSVLTGSLQNHVWCRAGTIFCPKKIDTKYRSGAKLKSRNGWNSVGMHFAKPTRESLEMQKNQAKKSVLMKIEITKWLEQCRSAFVVAACLRPLCRTNQRHRKSPKILKIFRSDGNYEMVGMVPQCSRVSGGLFAKTTRERESLKIPKM